MGGGSHTTTIGSKLAGLSIQQSTLGQPIPLGYGRGKLSCNLLDYLNFIAIPHTTKTKTGGGKGGGGSTTTTTEYTYSADVLIGICEGPITGINGVWKDSAKFTGPSSILDAGLNLATGNTTQTAWPYLLSVAPSHALAYRTLAYAYAQSYDLGSNGVVANHAFEIDFAIQFNAGGGIYDAAPKDILTDFLTNDAHGVPSWPASVNGNWTDWGNYCIANSLFLSPMLDSTTAASDVVQRLMDETHSDCFFSEGLLKIVPLGDAAANGHGVTWTPNLAPQYDLTEDDFVDGEVSLEIADQSDAYNYVQVEFLDRANEYETAIATAYDLDNIVNFGRRQQSPLQFHDICDAQVARNVAQLMLQRNLYIRDKYEFALPMDFIGLEPRDYVTLTTTVDGMKLNRQLVSILEISEDPEGQDILHFIAEGVPGHTASAALYAAHTATSFGADVNADPGNAAGPFVFNAPTSLATSVTSLEVWAAVAGINTNWGGCFVWVSFDGTNYSRVGQISAPVRYGTLASGLPSHADPDVVNTLAVDLSISRAALGSVTTTAADQGATLCLVADDSGGSYEYLSFGTATLTSAYHYNLTYLRRGQFNSKIATHAAGAHFVRLDEAVFKIPYQRANLGQTMYIKFQSYNVYGRALQDLSTLAPTTLVLAENGTLPGSPSGLRLAEGGSVWTSDALNLVCDPIEDATNYEFRIYKADGTTLIRTINSVVPAATYFAYMAALDGPQREYKISVVVSNSAGSLESGQLDVANVAPGLLSGVTSTGGSVGTISATPSSDPDIAGYVVHYHTVSGFNPLTDGYRVTSSGLPFVLYGLPLGTYYARIGAYDPWTSKPDLVNLSAEQTIVISSTAPPPPSGGGGGGGGGWGGDRGNNLIN